MVMVEQDLELLEEYLDGSLDAAQATRMEMRLKSDPNFSAALGDIKAQRALRSVAWQSIEPAAVEAERLVWRIRGAMLYQNAKVTDQTKKPWNSWRIASLSSAAAACMVLGFMIGRMGQGSHSMTSTPRPTDIASGTQPPSQLVEMKQAAPPAIATNTKISVPITNEYGQVVAWQTFDSPEQAKNFTEDLHRTHVQPTLPQGAGQTRLVDQQVPF